MEYILRTKGVSKKYHSKWVLKQVNMNIARGDIYGFVGENGSGKTTIIRIITGLIFADEGQVELFGVADNSHEIYSALSYLIPELSSLPPVWDLPYNESYYEEFLAIYDRIAELSSLELYHSLPAIIHYILRITGIENSRAHDPILRARLLLEENTALSAEQIAEHCGINYNTFRKQFKKSFGLSPVQYRIQHRIAVAKQLLAEGLPVGEIATSLGYPDIYTFTHQFTTITNQSPTDFRRRIEPQKPTSTSKQPRKQRI